MAPRAPTYPSQECLLLSYVVEEAQGPVGAVHAAVQVVVQVEEPVLLLLAGVRVLQLGAEPGVGDIAVRCMTGDTPPPRPILGCPPPRTL